MMKTKSKMRLKLPYLAHQMAESGCVPSLQRTRFEHWGDTTIYSTRIFTGISQQAPQKDTQGFTQVQTTDVV
jgi:hypothetical protein